MVTEFKERQPRNYFENNSCNENCDHLHKRDLSLPSFRFDDYHVSR